MRGHDDTASALDWHAVLHALAQSARTPMGRRAALALTRLPDVDAVSVAMDEVGELLALGQEGGSLPIGGVGDVLEPVVRASKGAVLERAELRAIGATLAAMDELSDALGSPAVELPTLAPLAPALCVDRDLTETLRDAFDPTGELSAATWPVLGELRDRINGLHTAIRRTLDELIKGDELADALQDRFVTQRGDRYVIPIKINHRRRDMGIVHGLSGSGQTAFVEPQQVVALNNDLRLAEGELEAAERRILTQLSGMVGRVSDAIAAATAEVVRVDLAAARADLAATLRATRPTVRAEGVIHLRRARHPLLALRGVPVVGNDLTLHDAQPILIISGPNTGGKTVALKTVGLCALLVRIGCWVPADEASRVDFFPHIVALIGDHQTVHGDHSSFSAHLASLRAMVDEAAPGCLYLIDEIASGTDPLQGAALAHAVLEHLLARGPRAVVTTHFHRLKTVGAVDPRFAMGGMQFAHGRPTWRLLTGMSGESHALGVAQQQGFPPALLDRARELMGADEHGLADVLTRLEEERTRAEEASERLEAAERALAEERAAVAAREATLRERARALEAQLAEGFRSRVEAAERAISAVVADLQRDPSHRKVDAARATLAALESLAPAPAREVAPAATGLKPGDRVRLLRLGHIGEVVTVTDGTLTVRSGALTVRVRPDEVTPVQAPKAARAAPTRPLPAPRAPRRTPLADAVRLPEITLDLRGQRVEDALEATAQFLADATAAHREFVFVLHGHGTGAMKEALRRWLPQQRSIADWAPASGEQGGDAYTVVGLR